jgi:hypothetical protein
MTAKKNVVINSRDLDNAFEQAEMSLSQAVTWRGKHYFILTDEGYQALLKDAQATKAEVNQQATDRLNDMAEAQKATDAPTEQTEATE